MSTSLPWIFVASTMLVGCADKAKDSVVAPLETGNLEAGTVARVGREIIVADDVARIAAAQGVGVAAARDLAIRDALFAEQAKAEGVDADQSMQLVVNAALARRMLRKLLDDADRAGPVTDEELERVMQRRWLELDRPEGFRVVHAVVRTKEDADEATRTRAEAVARAVREAVLPVAGTAKSTSVVRDQPDPVVDAFKRAAEAVSRDGFEIKVEQLPPIAADARLISPDGGGVEKSFAEGASMLAARGSLSDIVATSYGFHVLLLLERIPEARVSLEERRRSVRQEVLWMRAAAARAKLLERLRPDVLVGRDVDTLLVMVPVDR
ncbi:MAG: peptidyl-prolyl cis-trans isomerase [Polyangiaceae bacterium]|nr:peptidyl-prolyl cis-trans isomerase [Polyangiaceae bacterium]